MVQDKATAGAKRLKENCKLGSENTAIRILARMEDLMGSTPGHRLSGAVEAGSCQISGEDRGCSSHSTKRQRDEVLLACEVVPDSTEFLRLLRVKPAMDQTTAQIARWAFLQESVDPKADLKLGQSLVSALDSHRPEGMEEWPAPELRASQQRGDLWWQSHKVDAMERLESDLREWLTDLRKDHPNERIDRPYLNHYLTKFAFRVNHGPDPNKMLQVLFARALSPKPGVHPP